MILTPFTYWINDKERRVFLLADCSLPENQTPESAVLLIEWGKDRNEGVRTNVSAFMQLIQTQLLKPYFPKL